MIGLDYIAIGRKLLAVEELPWGALELDDKTHIISQLLNTNEGRTALAEAMVAPIFTQTEEVENREVDRFTDFLKSEDDW